MIEGIKVTVSASELKSLCRQEAEYHEHRAVQLGKQLEAGLGALRQSAGSRQQHEKNQAAVMRFAAEHVEVGDVHYLLTLSDLETLGVWRAG